MPLAAAKKAVGDKSPQQIKEEEDRKKEAMSEEMLKNRAEFDLNEDITGKAELYSWYLFDWATQVYFSVVISMFLPILLFYLADGTACPYTFLPENPNATEDSNWLDWNGHVNTSTTCTVVPRDIECNLDPTDDTPNQCDILQVFGGADGGLSTYPASNIVNYDNSLDKFYVDKIHFWSDVDAAANTNCTSTGDIEFGLVRNSSGWASGCQEGWDVSLPETQGCQADSFGSSHPPKQGNLYYRVDLDSTLPANSGIDLNALSVTVNSSNPEIIADGMKDVEYVGVVDQKFTLKLFPKMFAVGSTTLTVTVTDAGTGKVGVFKFTYNNIAHADCPYRVPFLGAMIRPITFSTWVIAFSVGAQAVLYVSISSFGDFGPFRKLLLCYCSLIGCISTMAIITCTKNEDYGTLAWLTILSNATCGGSMLFYSAYLPYLSRSHPTFLNAKFEYKNLKSGAATGVGAASKKLLNTYHDVCDHVSAEGYYWGYCSGCFSMVLAIAIIFMNSSLDGIRLIVFLSGCYWLVFSIPLFLFLHTRPGPDFPDDIKGNPLKAITFSWRRIIGSGYATFRNLPETKRFLIAYFFFSDGINTIANVAILFAMQDLGMNTMELTILAAEAPMFGAIGVKLYRRHQVKYGLSSKQMLLRGIWLLMLVPIYGSIGYIYDFVDQGFAFGMVQKTEMYFVCILFGMTLGPTQSYARTLFTDLIPPGQEAEYFGVFEISDRGSSWIGPLVCGAIYEFTGRIRHAMWYLMFVLCVGWYLVEKTDDIKGGDDCRRKEILVRMNADRKKFGVTKAGAPPSAKKMAGLKSSKMYTGQSGYSSVASSKSGASSVERSKFSMYSKNRVAPSNSKSGFGGATVVEGQDEGGGFNNQTVIEDTNDGGGFNNQTVIEDTNDGGGFNNQTVVEDTGGS